ncbi:glycosyltransferase family 39 protein [Patescibacteria group bacterium]|nr:glycosyltransferase family 39 protein [Patescibacteria group bacterium]
MNKKWQYSIVIGLLLIMFGLELTSALGKSQTNDEAVHLLAGYSYLTRHDFRLNTEHPPLTKYLAALPLLFLQPELDINHPGWQNTDQWSMAPSFLYHNTVTADTLLLWGRIPTMLLSLVLGWLIFVWSGKLFGAKAGLLALTFYVFSPNILAHSRLITSDLAITLFILLTFYFLDKYLEKPNTKNLLLFCLTFGLTLLTKFSAPIIIPIIILLLIIRWRQQPEKFSLQQVLLTIFALAISGLALIFLGYGFELTKMKDDPFFISRLNGSEQSLPFFGWLIPAYHYWFGLVKVFFHSLYGQGTYLFGKYSIRGWWYYFPLAFLVKTSLVTILLTIILKVNAIKTWWQQKPKFRQIPFSYFILVIPPLIYFLFTLISHLNLGLRHLLPIYPFLFIWIGSLANWSGLKRRSWQIVGGILIAFYLVSSFSIYPHYLAYFNETVAGAKNGPEYLLDSNLDWGQDYKTLQTYLAENNITHYCFNDTDSAKSNYYLPQALPIPAESEMRPGYIAISVNALYQENSPYSWLKKYQPSIRIGYSIYLFKF